MNLNILETDGYRIEGFFVFYYFIVQSVGGGDSLEQESLCLRFPDNRENTGKKAIP